MKTGLKRGLTLGLTACVAAASLAGCGKTKEIDPTAAVATLDGEELSFGAVSCLFRYQQAQFESMYSSWLKSYYGDNLWAADLTGSGETYGETFKNEIMSGVEKMLLTEKHMADYGVEITEDEAAAITAAAQEFLAANDEELLNKMYATQENLERILTLYTIQAKVEEEMGADVDTEVSDEEAAQRTVTYVRFDTKSEEESEIETEAETAAEQTEAETAANVTEAESVKTGSSDEEETEDEETKAAKAEAKERAEAFLAEAKEAEDFAAAAEEVTANDADASTSYYTFGDEDTYPDEAIITATKDLEDNTLVEEVIEVNNSYYVLHVDDAFDEDAVAEKKEEIIESRRLELVQDIYLEWMEASDFKVHEKVYDQLVYDMALTVEYATEASTESDTEAGSEAAETEEETEAVSEAAETEAKTETESEAAETEEVTEAESETAAPAEETDAVETEK